MKNKVEKILKALDIEKVSIKYKNIKICEIEKEDTDFYYLIVNEKRMIPYSYEGILKYLNDLI